MQRMQFCSCYKIDVYRICSLYHMSILTLAMHLSQNQGFSIIHSVFMQQKRALLIKCLCKSYFSTFSGSLLTWIAADLHFGVISSSFIFSLSPCIVSGIYSIPSRNWVHGCRQNPAPEICKLHDPWCNCVQHMYIHVLVTFFALFHLLHQKQTNKKRLLRQPSYIIYFFYKYVN